MIQKNPNLPFKFSCECCSFSSNNKKDYNRHLLTAKHQSYSKMIHCIKNPPQTNKTKFTCLFCNRSYSFSSGLSAHKRKCNGGSVVPEITTELILNIMQQNQEFKELLIEQSKNMMDMSKAVSPVSTVTTINSNNNVNNNSINKTFNLQVFLNETCKDAMNITDFVNSIQLQLSDFERIGEEGYVNGISNIIIKNLKAIDEHLRPVHCSDVKRETIYIKDNNQWQKDTNNNHNLKKVIKAIAHKNTKMMPKYREKYPETQIGTSKASDNYSRFVIEALGGSGDNKDEKEDKIVRRIAKEIIINK